MTLGELIDALGREEDKDRTVPFGFTHAHSYRGYYDQLAFEPAANVTVRSMLEEARSALGATFTGYKGGEYVMDEYTDVWLAQQGNCGEQIGPTLLTFMLGGVPEVEP